MIVDKSEKLNVLTHVIGIGFCLVAIPAAAIKLWKSADLIQWVMVGIFLVSMLLMFTSSTIYHGTRDTELKLKLKIVDHICIYILIAGTYTPFMYWYTDFGTAAIFLGIMWTMVIAGAIYKLFYIGRGKYFSIALYLFLGWMIVFVGKGVYESMPTNIFVWILGGGLSYTVGTFFYARSHRKYYHAIWHLFVLGGAVMHFIAAYLSIG